MRVEAYPWEALERLTRAEARSLAHARSLLSPALKLEALAEALASTLGGTARLRWRSSRITAAPHPGDAVVVPLELADGSARLALLPERALAQRLVETALGRPHHLPDLLAGIGPAFNGALAALLTEVARRAGGRTPLVLLRAPLPSTPPLQLGFSVSLDGRPYDAQVWLWLEPARSATGDAPALPEHSARSPLPLRVPLVAACVPTERGLLRALERGGAFLPGDAWTLGPDGAGPATLIAPRSTWGLPVVLAPDGHLVVGNQHVQLPDPPPSPEEDAPLGLPALEAPVVIRVEVATVSLSAQEWLRLRAGDVLKTDAPVPAPVVLRAAGVELARGELVNIEGEVGVRILSLTTQEAAE